MVKLPIIKPPIINPTNHAKFTHANESWEWGWQSCMEANNSINRYLDDSLGKSFDWGGKYATWLNNLGLQHQTDNGWWSLAAVDPDNLEAFIKDMTDETGEFSDKISEIAEAIKKLERIGDFKPRYTKVYKLLENFYSTCYFSTLFLKFN